MKGLSLHRFKISTQIIILFCFLSLLICTSISYISYRISADALDQAVDNTFAIKADDAAQQMAAEIENMVLPLEVLSRLPDITGMDWEQQLPVLQAEAEELNFQALGIATADGSLRQSDGRTTDISARPYFRDALTGKSVVSDPIVSNVDKSIVVMAAVPIYNSQGQVVGVLTGRTDYKALAQIISTIKFGDTGYGYMINKDGTTIAHTDEELVRTMDNTIEAAMEDSSLAELAAIEKKMAAGEKGHGHYTYNGQKKIVSYTPVPGTSWSIGIVQLEKEALSAIDTLRNTSFILTLVFLFICMVAGYVVGRQLGNPIAKAGQLCQKIAAGDLTVTVDKNYLQRKDEIGTLAQGFDKIINNFNSIIRQISQTSSQLITSSQAMNESIQTVAATMEQISASTQQISSGLQTVSASAEEVSASAEQMSDSVSLVAGEAQSAAENAKEIDQRAVGIARKINDDKDNVNNVYKEIRKKVLAAIEEAKIVEEISTLADSISGIAEQTNLLSLNAAIEAARAGEQGRGFAVVAEEVRKLAGESASTVKNIHTLTNNVQAAINDLVVNSQGLLKFINEDVSQNYDSMLQVGHNYQEDAGTFLKLAEDTSRSSAEVLATVEEINKALESVATTMAESAAGSQEIAESIVHVNQSVVGVSDLANTLTEEARKMDMLVEQFKTK